MRRGIYAGLIAGLIAGIVATICYILVPMLGLMLPYGDFPFVNMVEFYIIMNLFWSIIYGMVYSRFQGAIPGRGVMKGFYYGLALFLFTTVRAATYMAAYGNLNQVIPMLFINFFGLIVYGIILGALYKTDGRTVGKYDIGKGAHAGFIAGLIGGSIAFLSHGMYFYRYVWIDAVGMEKTSILLSHVTTQVGLNVVWGTILGILYTKVYDLIPKKGVLKGFVYALIAFLITSLHGGTYLVALTLTAHLISAQELFAYFFHHTIPWLVTGILQIITFGLVLGYLYKK